MERIYLRLLNEPPSKADIDQQLSDLKNAVEKNVKIKWETEPEVHPRGGYRMSGYISKDTDFEDFLIRLKNDGYIGVI